MTGHRPWCELRTADGALVDPVPRGPAVSGYGALADEDDDDYYERLRADVHEALVEVGADLTVVRVQVNAVVTMLRRRYL